jgi:hypothetical protein
MGNYDKNIRKWVVAVVRMLTLLFTLLILLACGSESTKNSAVTTNLPSTPTLKTSTFVPISQITTLASTNSQVWNTRWLKGVPCSPPCYENIMPGKTTLENAQKSMQQNSLIEKVELINSLSDSSAFLEWSWKKELNNNLQELKGGVLRVEDNKPNSSVKQIEPDLLPFKLSEVIQAYGEPEYVIATFNPKIHESGFYYKLSLFYFSKGFLIHTNPYKSTPIFNKEIEMDYVWFFPVGINGFQYYRGNISKELLVPWQGFKDWKFYCRYFFDSQNQVKNCDGVQGL